ncbi:acyl-CoA thioesterase [Leptolyngbya sp. AN02str]|uniref:acyl-CoA thioesterase n=1 Tax=Leptolyngbya sp. AN02str TaxID=3423363 RepID=UPI003D3189FF
MCESLPSKIAYTQEIEVQPHHCDVQNHVNNVMYVQWIQDLAIAAYNSRGYSRETDSEHLIWVVRRHEIDYLAPAFVGEQLQLVTWIESSKLTTLSRRTEVTRIGDRQILCRARTEWCYFNVDRNRPAKIPNEMKLAFLPSEK